MNLRQFELKGTGIPSLFIAGWMKCISPAIFVSVMLMIVTAGSCQTENERIREAVRHQVGLYPGLSLIDLYKAFFQAEFGAGHMLSDTAAAGRYLDYELTLPDESEVLYEPIGADAPYYRVHLVCVQKAFLTRNQLFDAFVSGVCEVSDEQIERWCSSWVGIVSVIDEMNLDLENYSTDKERIDSLLNEGQYAVHHSRSFNEKYNPHYRIVRGDIFTKELLPYLKEK